MEEQIKFAVINLLAVGFGLLHRWHVSTLFENEKHFSYLSNLEREMSFRTEMGLYYSYFKTIAESESFFDGIHKLNHDNISQYPNIINAASKYSLAPEINIGMFYHTIKFLGLMPKPVCWQVARGNSLSSVSSCEGIGVPIYFYLEFVWFGAIVTGTAVFLYSASLSESFEGGIIAIALFFYNHNDCTRVQRAPPLRESFAYPALLSQMFAISEILKKKKKPNSIAAFADITVITTFCLMCWQFSQFVFVTQTVAILILKWLKIINSEIFYFYCKVHLISVALDFCFHGNTFILSSLHLALIVVSYCSSKLSDIMSHRYDSKIITLLEIALTLVCSKLWKVLLTNISEDKHVFNILRSKLSSYKDFHTMLYTCTAEFDFLNYETYENLVKTFLLPIAILAGSMVLYYSYRNLETQDFPNCIEPHVAYTVLQTGAFTIMAIFVMRLKLLMVPHLCILAGLSCSKRYMEKLGIKNKITQGALIALLLAMMSYHGLQNLKREREIVGVYSNVDQEELLQWIQTKTPKGAVFAGKMSLMANIMLSTKRPIVNNPYYESKEMQDRTMKVYKIFSRDSIHEVYDTLRNLKVDYLVVDQALCYNYGFWKPGCKILELWDLVDKGKAKNEGKSPVCPKLFQGDPHPFQRVFENYSYVVLQLSNVLQTKYIKYKPKTILYNA